MNENLFKFLALFFFVIVVWSFCSEPERNEVYDVNVQTLVPASDGLDLKAVGALLKKAEDGEQFEKLLNSPEERVNNLDLNGDGQVDYIKVTEYGEGDVKGFSLTTEAAGGEEQELATIEVEKAGEQANVEIQGNEQIYGRNHYYHSSFGLGEMLLLGWMFSPHRAWVSPWGYGSYPGYYSPYSTWSQDRYRGRTSAMGQSYRSANSSTLSKSVTSPNAGKTASQVRAPLKNPTASQKQFQARSSSRTRSGGFGRSSSGLRSSSRSGGFRSGK